MVRYEYEYLLQAQQRELVDMILQYFTISIKYCSVCRIGEAMV